jgi:hypothetical protein
MLNGFVSRVEYVKPTETFSVPEINALLKVNAPDATWEPTKYDWNGTPTWCQGADMRRSTTYGPLRAREDCNSISSTFRTRKACKED